MEEQIKRFLAEQQLIRFDGDVDEHTDLFRSGLIDSYGYVELIRFLESEFGVQFSNEEILTDVVVSLAGITSLVSSKLPGHA